MKSSIVSYPKRGSFGNNQYQGNCTGKLIEDLLKEFKPKRFLECFAGGGTGFDVARSLGYRNSVHLDLNDRFGGFNLLTDEIPIGADFCFSHPPYWDIIKYSNNVWGNTVVDGDISHISNYDDFIKNLDKINAKIYASLKNGGKHAILVGDVRRNGKYYSIQKDMCWIGEPYDHIIKVQHNMNSNNKNYKGSFTPIHHEHLIILKKNQVWNIPLRITKFITCDLLNSLQVTWRDLIQAVIQELGGTATLKELYQKIENSAKAKKNTHFKEKIRQTLQIHTDFMNVERGRWSLSEV